MPKLKSTKHELFCRAVVNKHNQGNIKKAYQEVYPDSKSESARVNSSRLMDRPEVSNRVSELLNEQGLSIPALPLLPLNCF